MKERIKLDTSLTKTAALIEDVAELSGNLRGEFLKRRTLIQELLTDSDTYATTLLAICLGMYGTEIFNVDQLTVLKWLEDDFHVQVSEVNENRLNAALATSLTDYFFSDLDVFVHTCATFTMGESDLVALEPLTIMETFWGIYEVSLIKDNAVIENLDFSESILQYIQQVMKNESDPMFFTAEGGVDKNKFIGTIISSNAIQLKLQLAELFGEPDNDSSDNVKMNFPVFELEI